MSEGELSPPSPPTAVEDTAPPETSAPDDAPLDDFDVEEMMANLDPKDRKILSLMAELDHERERRKAVNMDIFRIKERVAEEVSRLEATIQEQDEQNEKLVAVSKLRQEELDIVQELLSARDKEVAKLKKDAANSAFQLECQQGDVQELSEQVARKSRLVAAVEERLRALLTAHATPAKRRTGGTPPPAAPRSLDDVEVHLVATVSDDEGDAQAPVWDAVQAVERQLAAMEAAASVAPSTASPRTPNPPAKAPPRADSPSAPGDAAELEAWRGARRPASKGADDFGIPASDTLEFIEEARVMLRNVENELGRLHADALSDAQDDSKGGGGPGALPEPALDFGKPVVALLRDVAAQTAAVVGVQLAASADLRDELQLALDERDEHEESLAQAGEFGQFLLQENEALKAKLDRAVHHSNSSTGMAAGVPTSPNPKRAAGEETPPSTPPSRVSAVTVPMGSPLFAGDSKDWSVIGGVGLGSSGEATAKSAVLKRTVEQLQRQNRALERDHQRAMDTLKTTDEELEAARGQLHDSHATTEELRKRLADATAGLTSAQVAAVDARAEAAAAQQASQDAGRQVARLQAALRQEHALSKAAAVNAAEAGEAAAAPVVRDVGDGDEAAAARSDRLAAEVERLAAQESELRVRLRDAQEQLATANRIARDKHVEDRRRVAEQEEVWTKERQELLAANSRLHDERMELRQLLDAERNRSSTSMFPTGGGGGGGGGDTARLQAELDDANESLAAARHKLAQAQAQVTHVTTAAKDTEADASSKVREAKGEASKLEAALGAAKEEVDALRAAAAATRGDVDAQVAALREELGALRVQVLDAQQGREAAEAAAEASAQHAKVVEAKAAEMSERFGVELGGLDASVAELKASLAKEQGHSRELLAKLEGKEEEVSQLCSKVVSLSAEMEQMVAQTALVTHIDKTRVQALERGLDETKDALDQYRAMVKQKTARIKSLETDRSKARETRLELEREIKALQAQVDKLQRVAAGLTRERNNLRAELAGWRQESKAWEDIVKRGGLGAEEVPAPAPATVAAPPRDAPSRGGATSATRRASQASQASAGSDVPPHNFETAYSRIVAHANTDPSAWRRDPAMLARMTPDPHTPPDRSPQRGRTVGSPSFVSPRSDTSTRKPPRPPVPAGDAFGGVSVVVGARGVGPPISVSSLALSGPTPSPALLHDAPQGVEPPAMVSPPAVEPVEAEPAASAASPHSSRHSAAVDSSPVHHRANTSFDTGDSYSPERKAASRSRVAQRALAAEQKWLERRAAAQKRRRNK